jgi:hypothetical protein
VKVVALPPEIAALLWDDCRPHLERAIDEHPGETRECLEELRRSVVGGERMILQIWDAGEVLAVALLEFADMRDGRCLWVRYLGGHRMPEWIDELQRRLAEIGRGYGCAWVGLTGRQGWRKVLTELDWQPMAVQMRARI